MEQQTSPFWSLPAAQVLGRLETTPEGLSAAGAASRLKHYAARRLAPKKRTDALTLLLGQFSSPIVLLLLGATAISLFLHDITDAAIILAIVLASGLLGFWQERGAAGAVEKLLSLVEVKAQVLRDATPHDVPLDDVVPGDVVLLSAGTAAPGETPPDSPAQGLAQLDPLGFLWSAPHHLREHRFGELEERVPVDGVGAVLFPPGLHKQLPGRCLFVRFGAEGLEVAEEAVDASRVQDPPDRRGPDLSWCRCRSRRPSTSAAGTRPPRPAQ